VKQHHDREKRNRGIRRPRRDPWTARAPMRDALGRSEPQASEEESSEERDPEQEERRWPNR